MISEITNTGTDMTRTFLYLCTYLCVNHVYSWCSPKTYLSMKPSSYCITSVERRRKVYYDVACRSKEEDSDSTSDEIDLIVEPKAAEYGVSYIGGDPCGSKYNNDPFDTQVTKPGMPDDMKMRIKALAEQKKKSMRKSNAQNDSS